MKKDEIKHLYSNFEQAAHTEGDVLIGLQETYRRYSIMHDGKILKPQFIEQKKVAKLQGSKSNIIFVASRK